MFEEIKPLQQVEFEVLKEFDKVCKKYDLKYFLAFGTCLGAVRHQGFIPWDDDIDVIMPYEDYQKLLQLDNSVYPENYFFQSYESEPACCLCYSKLRKSDTTLIAGSLADKDVNHGINIDIYPYYALADKKFARKKQHINTLLWMLLTINQKPKNHGGLMAFCSKVLLGLIPNSRKPKMREKAFKKMLKYEGKGTQNVYFAIGNVGEMKRKYATSWFETAIPMQFEGQEFPVPVGYKEYLISRYGDDYMQLPPESEQGVKLNDILAWSAEIPYTEYQMEKAEEEK